MNRLPRGWRGIAWIGVVVGVFAAFVALPPIEVRSPVAPVVIGLFALTIGIGSWIRGERKVGGYAVAAGVLGFTIGYLATRSSVGNLETVVVWGALLAAMLRYATPLAFASIGGLFSERSGVVNIGLEGMMLTGAFFAVWGSDVTGAWPLGSCDRRARRRPDGASARVLLHLPALGPDRGRHGHQLPRARSDRATSTSSSTATRERRRTCRRFRTSSSDSSSDIPWIGNFLDDVFGQLNLMIWLAILLVFVTWVVVFKTPIGLRIRSVGEHPRAADTVGISVYAVRYGAVIVSGMLAAAGGAYLSLGFVNSFSAQHDGRARVHRPRGPDLRQLATVRRRGRLPPVRLLERPRRLPPGVLDVDLDAVRRASLRPHARRRRRCHRPLDPARLGRTTVRQAVSAVARANGLPRARNGRAWASVVVGMLAVGVCPLAIASSELFDEITLVQSCALGDRRRRCSGSSRSCLARRGTETVQRTLGRSGGGGAARIGKALGVIALWIAATVGLCRRLLLAADALRRLSAVQSLNACSRSGRAYEKHASAAGSRSPMSSARRRSAASTCARSRTRASTCSRARRTSRVPPLVRRLPRARRPACSWTSTRRASWVDEEQGSRRARRIRVREQHHRRAERNMVVFTVLAIGVVTALVIAAWNYGGAEARARRSRTSRRRTRGRRRRASRPSSNADPRDGGASLLEVREGRATGNVAASRARSRRARRSGSRPSGSGSHLAAGEPPGRGRRPGASLGQAAPGRERHPPAGDVVHCG